MTLDLLPYMVLVFAGLGLGVGLGRRTSKTRRRVFVLEKVNEELRQARERARVELQAANDEVKRAREELERYRGSVVGHFAGTSDLLRELTLQYRAVYDHLTEGAAQLCPEGALGDGGLSPDALPPEASRAVDPEERAPEAGE